MTRTNVRSTMARRENAGKITGERCPSTYTTRRAFGTVKAGQTIRCVRPAGRHRIHEAHAIQWESKR